MGFSAIDHLICVCAHSCRSSCWLLVLLTTLGLTPISTTQASEALLKSQIGLFVTSLNSGPPVIDSRNESDEGDDFAFASDLIEAPGAAHSLASATAKASFGHLQLSASAIAGDAKDEGGGASAVASATASWSDSIVVSTPIFEPGHPLRLRTAYLMPGSVKVDATAGPFGGGDAQANATVSVGGLTYFFSSDDAGPITGPPAVINFILDANNEQILVTSTSMSIEVDAATTSGLANGDVNYSNSLHWGGILSVEDALTGQVITDWMITSESGTDYSQPIGLPEPSTLALSAIGALALLAHSLRRRFVA